MKCLLGELKSRLIIGSVQEEAYVYGALRPATGDVLTETYPRSVVGHYVEFLERVEQWLPPEVERVYAIVDNLYMHSSYDVIKSIVTFMGPVRNASKSRKTRETLVRHVCHKAFSFGFSEHDPMHSDLTE